MFSINWSEPYNEVKAVSKLLISLSLIYCSPYESIGSYAACGNIIEPLVFNSSNFVVIVALKILEEAISSLHDSNLPIVKVLTSNKSR